MTESEAWDSLAEHLKQKNYTGVLVLADWFQENDKEEVAVYLRWAERKKYLPEFAMVKFNSASVESPCWKCKCGVEKGIHTCFIGEENLKREITNGSIQLKRLLEWYCD